MSTRRRLTALLATALLALTPLTAAAAAPRSLTPHATSMPTPATLPAYLAGIKELNYYPVANNWSQMWTQWNPATINADFARIAALHANTVRVYLQASTIGYPVPSTAMMAEIAQVVTLANANGLRVHLTLFDWWGSYSNIAGSERWAHVILAPFAGDPRLAVVELQNEIDPSNRAAVAWAQTMLPFVRAIDGGIPVTISVNDQGPTRVSRLQALVTALGPAQPDFYDYHIYPDVWYTAAYAALVQAKAIVAPRPLFVGEVGFSTSLLAHQGIIATSPAALEAYQDALLRSVEYDTAALGLPAAAPWTLQDFAPGSLKWTSLDAEYHFGLFRADGSAKPAAASIRAFFTSGSVDTSFNNSFEASYSSGGTLLPADWLLNHASEGHLSLDTTVARSGSASIRLSATTGDPAGVPSFVITPIAGGVAPGSTHTATVYAKGYMATGLTTLSMAFMDSAGHFLGNKEARPLATGTTGWTQLSVTATAPPNTAYVQLHCKSGYNSGTVWFDDVTFN